MPLSTVVVLNKVSFVDLVTVPEIRKFDILTSKKNSQLEPTVTKELGFRGTGTSSWSHRSYRAGSGAGVQCSQHVVIFLCRIFLSHATMPHQ